MEKLENIQAGMNGALVAANTNSNMAKIYEAIKALENKVQLLSMVTGTDDSSDVNVGGGSVTITASQDSILVTSSESKQTVTIEITVKNGSDTLYYGEVDNGINQYAASFAQNVLSSDGTINYASVVCRPIGEKLFFDFSINADVIGTFNYPINVEFRGVKNTKTLNFTILSNNIGSDLRIELEPPYLILNEISAGTISFDTAVANYSATYGDENVTNTVYCTLYDDKNCEGEWDGLNHQLKITALNKKDSSGVETWTKTDIHGNTTTGTRAVKGALPVVFSYTKPNGTVIYTQKNLSFAVNYLGSFRESIENDVHRTVSEKVKYELDEGGYITSTSASTLFQQSSSGFTMDVKAVKDSLSGLSGSVSSFQATANEITMGVRDLNDDLKSTGINLTTKEISMTTGTLHLSDSSGNQLMKVDKDGAYFNGEVNATSGTFNGDVNATSFNVMSKSGDTTKMVASLLTVGDLKAKYEDDDDMLEIIEERLTEAGFTDGSYEDNAPILVLYYDSDVYIVNFTKLNTTQDTHQVGTIVFIGTLPDRSISLYYATDSTEGVINGINTTRMLYRNTSLTTKANTSIYEINKYISVYNLLDSNISGRRYQLLINNDSTVISQYNRYAITNGVINRTPTNTYYCLPYTSFSTKESLNLMGSWSMRVCTDTTKRQTSSIPGNVTQYTTSNQCILIGNIMTVYNRQQGHLELNPITLLEEGILEWTFPPSRYENYDSVLSEHTSDCLRALARGESFVNALSYFNDAYVQLRIWQRYGDWGLRVDGNTAYAVKMSDTSSLDAYPIFQILEGPVYVI